MTGVAAHSPVMPQTVLEVLGGPGRHVFLDCTVGLGGHAELLLSQAPADAQLIGMDLDADNLVRAGQRLKPLGKPVRLFQGNFSQARTVLDEAGISRVDALLADLGVASSQLDDPARGLSFSQDGPLDMRLDRTSGRPAAADLVAKMDEGELADLIYAYGEERYSRRIARAIVLARQSKPITTTGELAAIVLRAYPGAAKATRRGVHPATRTFQALRIAVNGEMENLDALLAALPEVLGRGGRACIISFHSLEDRRVKHAFADLARAGRAALITKKPRTADEDEIARNPRSRSAKLRCLEMT
ncbi:MAG: 16S rRNA (cytosine(1402)-N(4))-methyltransferase RsmH [Planctomycetaceae bacterium]|nr:16S rRNA (cytosine(1402)-N(4))-methyltransferase RsmH [Planctomycetaceae bacterium]